MKKIILAVSIFISLALFNSAYAASVNLTVRDGANIVFSGPVNLPTNVTNLNDATNVSRAIDPNSVLALLASADQTSSNFSISNLTYFSSFNSLYLKCIADNFGQRCDDWQYAINNSSPNLGMDKDILSGGENVYIYFGPQNKVVLSSNNISTGDILTVSTQKYDYVNDGWLPRTGVTIGITEPNPSDPFNPIEVRTAVMDATGRSIFSAIPIGSYNVGVKEDFYFPTEPLSVTDGTAAHEAGGGSGGGSSTPATNTSTGKVLGATTVKGFNLEKAYDFLVSKQKDDGSFGEDLYTDWTTLALANSGRQAETIKITKYFEGLKLSDKSTLTDYERHTIALLSLGLNPYNTNGVNYIKKITDSFDGKQFGDVHEDNDDIFALIALQNAGYTKDDTMIQNDIAFILKNQKTDGSWNESVDMTGAGMEALSAFSDVVTNPNDLMTSHVKDAIYKAKWFLKGVQEVNGAWGDNASSTAWAMEGILAIGEKPVDWKKADPTTTGSNNSPIDYLNTVQDTDGGIKDTNQKTKIWETAYTASAVAGKTWNQVMQKFDKPKDASGNVLGASIKVKPKMVVHKKFKK